MKEYYQMIFKRKSFHLFRDNKTKKTYDTEKITPEELKEIYSTFKTLQPLVKDINVDIKIVSNEETNCKRGQEYCILFYSETKTNYLQNIGFIGEQLDLYLASKNIGTLWYGIGKTQETKYHDLDYVIMMAIAKVPENAFRKDMFKSKRKDLREIYEGNKYQEILNIARFAPSSCNTQPWIVKDIPNGLSIYRYKKPGKRGIMPVNKVVYQNLIDIGIFIAFLSICLEADDLNYQLVLYDDNQPNQEELTPIANISIDQQTS